VNEGLRRTIIRFAVLGVAAYAIFLVATLPAAWFGYALERSSNGALVLGEPRGTVWKGRGALAVRSGQGYRSVADIEWRCNPLSIFTGRLSVAVSGDAPGASLKGSVSLGLRSVRLEKLDASLPASLVEQAYPAAAFFKPEGRLRLTADSLEIGPASVRGGATAEWAEVGMMGVTRLGEYRLQVTGTGDRAGLTLSTSRGDLRLSGNGEWRAAQPRQVQMRGVAEATPSRKDLEPLLVLLAGEGTGNSRPFGWMMTI
jgi:general secretion pathway protein N